MYRSNMMRDYNLIALIFSAQAFAVVLSRFKLAVYRFGVNYDFNRWVGIGVAYSLYKIRVKVKELAQANLTGEFAYNYKGAVLFIRAGF